MSLSERAKQAAGLPQTTNGKVPEIVEDFLPPAHLAEFAERDAGQGVSTSADDNLVPLIYVLQPLSPQCDRRSPQYVEGAEAGDLWLRNAPMGLEVVKANFENARAAGQENFGLLAQPCYFHRDVVEWVPRDEGGGGGQGFVGRHAVERAQDVAGAKPGVDRKTGKADPNAWTTADGEHDLVETRNHAVLLHLGGRALPYLLPLTSTGHSVSRAWMSKINQKLIDCPVPKGDPDYEAKVSDWMERMARANKPTVYPSYAYLYRLTTEQRSNNQGKWFSIVVQDARWATRLEYLAGRKLHEQFAKGERRAEAPAEQDTAGSVQAASPKTVDASI